MFLHWLKRTDPGQGSLGLLVLPVKYDKFCPIGISLIGTYLYSEYKLITYKNWLRGQNSVEFR